MGFKYQVLSVKSPQQFLQLTLVHLEKLKEMVQVTHIFEVSSSFLPLPFLSSYFS